MKRVLSILLALCLVVAALPAGALAAGAPTQQEVQERIMAMQPQYPTGTPWSNADYYAWKGGIYS